MRFNFNWKITAFLILVLIVVGNLGFWQVRRYHEAVDTLATYRIQHDKLAPLTTLAVPEGQNRETYLHHRRASLTGRLLPDEAHLLTARYKFQKPGYGVLLPIQTQTEKVLVYIGWVPRERLKEYLDSLDPAREVSVEGRLTLGDNHGGISDPAGEHLGHTTWRETNLAALQQRIPGLEADILLQAGVQATGEPIDINDIPLDGYKGAWHVPPQRHVEYAIQWFGFGAAALGVYIALSFRRRKKDPSDQSPE